MGRGGRRGREVTAVDIDAKRLRAVRTRAPQARVVRADGRQAPFAPGSFPLILIDAPCSGSGVIRRHPDIKLLRREEQLPVLLTQQRRLLDALWPLLAPGGTLLYATCSVLCEENEAQIDRFASAHDDVTVLPIEAPWGHARPSGRQVLPGQDGMDGFFYALLRRG